MKEKKNGIIQAVVGLIILIIGIVLCVNTYVGFRNDCLFNGIIL